MDLLIGPSVAVISHLLLLCHPRSPLRLLPPCALPLRCLKGRPRHLPDHKGNTSHSLQEPKMTPYPPRLIILCPQALRLISAPLPWPLPPSLFRTLSPLHRLRSSPHLSVKKTIWWKLCAASGNSTRSPTVFLSPPLNESVSSSIPLLFTVHHLAGTSSLFLLSLKS